MADEAKVPKGVMDPTGVSLMAGSGASLSFTDLDESEQAILDRDLGRLSVYSESRALDELWRQDRDTYLWGASVAKKQLGDIPFKGLLALGSGVFGMQPVRSILINGTQTWLVAQASTGWSAKVWNINLATNTGSITNTNSRVVLVIPRLANFAASPKVSQVQWAVGPTKYAPQVMDWYKVSNLWVSRNIGAVFVSKNGAFTTDFLVEFTGTDGTAAWGLAFATGDWLNLQS